MAAPLSRADRGTASWRIWSASARGTAHIANGLPNQDAVASSTAPLPDGAIAVAVADGHGHRRHFRSATGSALAVSVACDVGAGMAPKLRTVEQPAEAAALTRSTLVPQILARWRAAVADDVAAAPFSPQEQDALDAAGDGPEIPYGSTLLLAVLVDRWIVCAQIGDGDVVAVPPDGRAFLPVPNDPLLDGQRTTSLCQPDAFDAFRIAVHDLADSPLQALLLATDGYGNAQVSDPWPPGVGADLVRFLAEHGADWFGSQIDGWAEQCASSGGSGDDTTMALMVNTDPSIAVPPPARGPALSGPSRTADGASTLPASGPPPPPAAAPRAPSPRSPTADPPAPLSAGTPTLQAPPSAGTPTLQAAPAAGTPTPTRSPPPSPPPGSPVAAPTPHLPPASARTIGSAAQPTVPFTLPPTPSRQSRDFPGDRSGRPPGGIDRRWLVLGAVVVVLALVVAVVIVATTSNSSKKSPPPTHSELTQVPPTQVTTTLPIQKGASENGAATNITMAAGSSVVPAKDPVSGAPRPITLPPAVVGAGPQSGQQVGGMVFVLAGNRVWRLAIDGPNANPPPSTLPLRSPGPFIAPPLVPGQVTLSGDSGLIFYLINPVTMDVSCRAAGADQSVCTGAIGNAKG